MQLWLCSDLKRHVERPTLVLVNVKNRAKIMFGGRVSDVWETYGLQTTSAAAQLCEQLRIVLEPTLSGRFSGDYRTGKRLSMRKVVTFIASNFRRDKIWLRRTRPSRRDYRIVIALDNSRSMSECGVGQKALKAIATVCMAFQRLELGKTGLCAFGG